MADKTISEFLETKNARNVSEYRQAMAEYSAKLNDGAENLEIPLMSATVGGIKYEKSEDVNIPFTAKNANIITHKLNCPSADDIAAVNDAIKNDGVALQNVATDYDANKLNSAMFDKLISVAPPPVTIIEANSITEEKILQQCIDNYGQAGETGDPAKLPRKHLKTARMY